MYKPQETEKEILAFWEEKKIFEKLRKKNEGKKRWSFIDGPITANNPMGVHHALGRTYKDMFQRFKAMQGYEQRFQNGFDCQGLWVEREEEKELGLKNKEDIEKFGILNFVNACKKRVEKFSKIQTEQSKKLGMWMDWENSYYTMSDKNNLHNWHLIKQYSDKGWLYKGNDSVPWCWRCGTASSKHDIVTEGYKEVTHTALLMQFPLKKNPDEYFLIFTTTPWTVPVNAAIALNPNIEYVKIENQKNDAPPHPEGLPFGQIRLRRSGVWQRRSFFGCSGSDPSLKAGVSVDPRHEGVKYWIAESRLSEIEGNYKVLDKRIGKEFEGEEYIMPYASFEEQKNSPHKVVLWELASGKEGTGIVHIAPGCGAEDFDLGKKENLPAISPLDEAGVYKKGFENFSFKKYSQVNKEVISDLEQRRFVYKIKSIRHRYPHCWRCGEELVFRVVDEWYIKSEEIRKGIVSENKKINWYPEYGKKRQEEWLKNMGDWLISRKRYWGLPLPIWECECGNIEVIGSIEELKNKAVDKKKVESLPEVHRPWIDEIKIKCICGKEISRIKDVGDAWLDAGIVPFSTLNYLNDKKYWKEWFPAELISESIPGQFRGWFNALLWASVTLTGKTPFKAIFGYETVKDEKGEEMHKSKGNAVWFDDVVNRAGADTIRLLYMLQDPAQELRFGFTVLKEPMNNLLILYNLNKLLEAGKSVSSKITEDKWIISKVHSLVKNVSKELENLHPHQAMRAIQNFWVNELSRGYVQLVRDRIAERDMEAQSTLRAVYILVVKLAAPFIPFLTETIWQDLRKKGFAEEESVHLSEWPKAESKKIDNKLEQQFIQTLKLIEIGLAERDKVKIGLRWPLASVILSGANVVFDSENSKELQEILARQLNVKKIIIGKRRELAAEFDTKMTPALEAEGFAREITRKIQAERKNASLKKGDLINLVVYCEPALQSMLESHKETIKERTNSKKIFFTDDKAPNEAIVFTIRERKIAVSFS